MILVTGANGFVGSRLCHELADREVEVRALVRRAGTAPDRDGVTEVVGEFDDPDAAPGFVDGVDAVVTTVAPMGADQETQHRVSVDGTTMLAAVARDAGVGRLVHVSTCAVYDRDPEQGDVDETSAYVDDDGGAYAVTKRDADLELAELDGITRVLVRPPAIMGPGPTSVWNTLRPARLEEDPSSLAPNPDQTFAWVHVDDLARFLADVATGVATPGPADGDVTAVNVAAPDATWRDYLEPVATALGVEPTWSDEPAWTGRIIAERARSWGWTPTVTLEQAIRELVDDLDDR
ncbi:NAD-dependent epimerase/dehydratase family protein [Salsipaludibacter albus]|uniref:NAD-dependent epimerase/dehydratase family protein n=1 Tax=Salsipaludibacter albus TaxID=2849650 RepID=UPI001EE3D43C|nr:NAD(P)-dependent oxidoreductase [Salsipaludibacter albus]MBY5163397.1 NAD(P)-dependent oxidoreductase [Salsipaludibacter albus]